MGKIKVGLLGATGTVGQTFIILLQNHKVFEISKVGAGPNSIGKKYSLASTWRSPFELDPCIADLLLVQCKPENFKDCKIIFSALDSNVASDIEKSFFEFGYYVFSNARNYRMVDNVPIVVPTCNPQHLGFIQKQREKGFIVTNSNCSTSGLVVVLKALIEKFGEIEAVQVTTMQAISGAGYPGLSALDIINNVVPYISGEEEKMESEPLKILGNYNGICSTYQKFKISATCCRTNVINGHTECVSIRFANSKPSVEEAINCLENYDINNIYKTESFPKNIIKVMHQKNRPQPSLDVNTENGFCVVVGRIKECSVNHIKLVLLIHNTVLGAAGSSILNAEIALKLGKII